MLFPALGFVTHASDEGITESTDGSGGPLVLEDEMQNVDADAGIMPAAEPRITPTISLTSSAPDNKTSDTADVTNTTVFGTTTLTVTATDTSQYAIYVQETANGGSLVNGSSKLTQLTTSRTYDTIDAGKWGYALVEGAGVAANAASVTYKAAPSNTTTAAYTGTTASGKDFTLAFAAKFADSNTAGHYTGNVIVSVAANPGEVMTLYTVTYNANNNTGGVTPATQVAESSNATYTFGAPAQGDLVKTGYIREAFETQPRLFIVITKDELAHLIQYGGDERMSC